MEQLQAGVRAAMDARRGEWDPRVADVWASDPVLTGIEELIARTLRR